MTTKDTTQIIPIPPAIYVGNFGLGGCPFLFGIFKHMKEVWGDDFYEKTAWYADGFSVIFVIQLLCGHTSTQIEQGYKSVIRKMHSTPNYWTGQTIWLDMYVQYILQNEPKILSILETHPIHIGVTVPFCQHTWKDSWKSLEELYNYVKASYNIPLYCNHCETIEGEEVVYGSYSCTLEDLILVDENIFKISTNLNLSDIFCRLSTWDTYFINQEESLYNYFFGLGYESCFNEIDRNNIDDRNSDDSMNKNRYRGMNVGMLWVCWIGKGIQLTYEYIVQEIIEK